MIKLNDYIILLKMLSNDIKNSDKLTAYNIAKELSAIYLKLEYDIPSYGTIERITSLIAYIKKTIPNDSELLVMVLSDILVEIKNVLNHQD